MFLRLLLVVLSMTSIINAGKFSRFEKDGQLCHYDIPVAFKIDPVNNRVLLNGQEVTTDLLLKYLVSCEKKFTFPVSENYQIHSENMKTLNEGKMIIHTSNSDK